MRKRPGSSQPPRALLLLNPKNSSFPSASVVSATTITFALCTLNTWKGDFTGLNQSSEWLPYVLALVMYVVSSFVHINMGAVYPSDCLLSIVPIVLVCLTHWIGALINEASEICPSCDGGFCYYDPSQQSVVQNVVLRSNLNMWSLHGMSNTLMLVAGFVVLTVLVYPIQYWQKTTYFLSMMLAVWIF